MYHPTWLEDAKSSDAEQNKAQKRIFNSCQRNRKWRRPSELSKNLSKSDGMDKTQRIEEKTTSGDQRMKQWHV